VEKNEDERCQACTIVSVRMGRGSTSPGEAPDQDRA
jgi:hypothetical protein